MFTVCNLTWNECTVEWSNTVNCQQLLDDINTFSQRGMSTSNTAYLSETHIVASNQRVTLNHEPERMWSEALDVCDLGGRTARTFRKPWRPNSWQSVSRTSPTQIRTVTTRANSLGSDISGLLKWNSLRCSAGPWCCNGSSPSAYSSKERVTKHPWCLFLTARAITRTSLIWTTLILVTPLTTRIVGIAKHVIPNQTHEMLLHQRGTVLQTMYFRCVRIRATVNRQSFKSCFISDPLRHCGSSRLN
jgi:hypothetical protein